MDRITSRKLSLIDRELRGYCAEGTRNAEETELKGQEAQKKLS